MKKRILRRAVALMMLSALAPIATARSYNPPASATPRRTTGATHLTTTSTARDDPFFASLISYRGQSWSIPPADWSVPGTVIDNLDYAPGSPFARGQKVVALTFDDGPSPVYTPQILSILVAHHVPASFEIVGEHAAEYPAIVQQEAAEGMSLVNHTWSHVALTGLSTSGWSQQVDRTNSFLETVTGHPVHCLRVPYGRGDGSVLADLAQRGLAELAWNDDPSDYLRPAAPVITQRVMSALHPGAIVILHDGGGDRSRTVAALPELINAIQAAGYEFAPVCGG